MLLNRIHFSKVIRSFNLFASEDVVLVAVSGGIDSVVLCHLLHESQQRFSIAHVNYGLRGAESDGDEEFVQSLAAQLNVACFVHRENRSTEEHIPSGIQEWARDIRYSWFVKLLRDHKMKFVLTAHHQNDQAETILHQFIRGGTLAALRGMLNVQGEVIRPLLEFSREEIVRYATERELKWREDSSNEKSVYSRNLIRNEFMPMLKKLNPALTDSLTKRAAILQEAEALVSRSIAQIIDQQKLIRPEGIFIPVPWFERFEYKRLLLWQLMEPLGFSSGQVNEALDLIQSQKGRRIESLDHQLWRQEKELVLRPKNMLEARMVVIDALPQIVHLERTITLSRRVLSDVYFSNDQSEVFMDYDKVKLPLIIRTWKAGDQFVPLGMQGTQNVSDFLIHRKVPSYEKNQILILETNGEIAAIIGYRISELYRITDSTLNALSIVLE